MNVHDKDDLLKSKRYHAQQAKEYKSLWQKAKALVLRRKKQLAALEDNERKPVRRPKQEVTMAVRNQSSRNGVTPRLIVLHSTESSNATGLDDLRAIGGWFDNPSAQASSHICIDGEGNTARYVADGSKAWHVAAYNSQSLGIEQIGHASQTAWPDAQIRKTAKWIAYWSSKYDIPIAHSTTRGVCCHSDLGSSGGGHHDPGAAYPFDRVLALARKYRIDGW